MKVNCLISNHRLILWVPFLWSLHWNAEPDYRKGKLTLDFLYNIHFNIMHKSSVCLLTQNITQSCISHSQSLLLFQILPFILFLLLSSPHPMKSAPLFLKIVLLSFYLCYDNDNVFLEQGIPNPTYKIKTRLIILPWNKNYFSLKVKLVIPPVMKLWNGPTQNL